MVILIFFLILDNGFVVHVVIVTQTRQSTQTRYPQIMLYLINWEYLLKIRELVIEEKENQEKKILFLLNLVWMLKNQYMKYPKGLMQNQGGKVKKIMILMKCKNKVHGLDNFGSNLHYVCVSLICLLRLDQGVRIDIRRAAAMNKPADSDNVFRVRGVDDHAESFFGLSGQG